MPLNKLACCTHKARKCYLTSWQVFVAMNVFSYWSYYYRSDILLCVGGKVLCPGSLWVHVGWAPWHGSRLLWAAQFPLQGGFVWLFSLFKEVITDSWSVFLEVPDPLTLSHFASFNNSAAVRSLPLLLRLLGKIGSLFSDSERWEHVFRPAESLALIFFFWS